MRFVCLSETHNVGKDRQGILTGEIFIISDENLWNAHVNPRLNDDFAKFNSYRHDISSPSIESEYRARAIALSDFCRDHSSFYTRFSLKRNGIVDIYLDEHLMTASGSPRFPTNANERQHVRLLLAAQAFFFLRDIGHTHKHHSPKTDTIVDLHEFDAVNDFDWRLATLYSIYRRIISYKRSDIIEQQISSVGLLAYAQAFKNICREDAIIHLPVFYDDSMRASIQANETKIRFRRQNLIDLLTGTRTIIFAILGLVFSIVGLANLDKSGKIKPATWILDFAQYAASYPFIVFGIAGIAGMTWMTLERRLIRVERSELFRGWQSLGQPFGRALVSMSMILVGLAFIWLAFFIIQNYEEASVELGRAIRDFFASTPSNSTAPSVAPPP
jgi:hypothetical protein